MNHSPLTSHEQYLDRFEQGLLDLLQGFNELGVFVLVLTNASFNSIFWGRLEMPLRVRFRQLVEQLESGNTLGLVLDDADDDLEVFEQLRDVGISRLRVTEFKFLQQWEIQFNQLRSFRPSRMTQAETGAVSQPFDPQAFNFNRPYLRKEIFWSGTLAGRFSAIFYNKFPFVDLHGLFVPEPSMGYPQLMTAQMNDYMWRVADELALSLPGVGFGYNSIGANASVNHLHFQMFQRERVLPVATSQWIHNGGTRAYPATCFRFDSAESSWRFLAELQRREVSYNLIYLPGLLYCLPRRRQVIAPQPDWTSGFAWYEMAGGFMTFAQEDFAAIGNEQIMAELRAISLDPVVTL